MESTQSSIKEVSPSDEPDDFVMVSKPEMKDVAQTKILLVVAGGYDVNLAENLEYLEVCFL